MRRPQLQQEASLLSKLSPSDPFTAHSLQYVSTQPALVVTQPFLHAYETPSCLPTHFAVTLSMYTLIPTVYRALLKSAVSGIGHQIHTTEPLVLWPITIWICEFAVQATQKAEHKRAGRTALTLLCESKGHDSCLMPGSSCSLDGHSHQNLTLACWANAQTLQNPCLMRICTLLLGV